MPTYLHPGVYVEEVSGGARPIEGVGTSTAAFVGIAEKGPIDESRFVTNFTEFQQIYGGYVKDTSLGASYLAYSVYQFFQNGGTACYIVRVEKDAKTARLDVNTDAGIKTISIEAISPGAWGNGLRIAIGKGTTSNERFNLYVFMKDELVETLEDLSMVNSDPFYIDRVTKRSPYIKTTAEELEDNPVFIGKKIDGTVNLHNVKNIRLKINEFGPYPIDCSKGKDASSDSTVSPEEICANINAAFQDDIQGDVATIVIEDSKKRIKIKAPTADVDSKIVFAAPSEKDATYDIFGLQEYSWVVNAGETTTPIALAYGLANADVIHSGFPSTSPAIKLALGTTTPLPSTGITLLKITGTSTTDFQATLFQGVLAPINTGGMGEIAFTDGKHIILKANQDIKIEIGPAARLIFGDAFYSYVHYSVDAGPAAITSTPNLATIASKQIKLKIDNYPSFFVSFESTDSNLAAVVGKINAAFNKVSKSKKPIASSTGANLTINSITQGASGRIIVSSHTGNDGAALIFGTSHVKSTGYHLIPAELQTVAVVSGNSPAVVPTGKTLRISVGDETRQITIASTSTTLSALFTTDFANVGILNYRILTAGSSVQMIAAASAVYFSIPLTGSPLGEALETTAASTDADAASARDAYKDLFQNSAPFSEKPSLSRPEYTYEFKSPDNNPKKTFTGSELDTANNLSLTGGGQNRLNGNDLANFVIGSYPGEISGLNLLDKLTDISILVIPGWERMDATIATKFVNDGTAYCDKQRPVQARPLRDLFFVTNAPKEITDPNAAKDFVQGTVNKSTGQGYSALYYPWIEVSDPIGTASPTILIPPAGAIAGLYANIDGRRGVWKAPAGTEAGVAGVVKLADQVNDIKQDLLNPFGVNVIRRMPGAGIVSWGARTLYTNPEWKYIPVRRTAIMMEVSIYEGIQWAVFEPNDEPLWSSLRMSIGAFMMNLFRSGAFQGSKPEEAFFVKCDKETTTQIDIDLGKVNVLVGFAPLKPAEFVIVRISQMAGKKQ